MTVFDLRQRPVADWTTRFTELLGAENDWLATVGSEVAHGVTGRLVESLLLDESVLIVGASGAGRLDAAAAVGPSNWDSAHFGLAVHRLHGFAVARGIAQPDDVATMLVTEGILPRIASAEIVMARVSLDAVPELNALEAAGFRTMDVQLTWMRKRVAGGPIIKDPSIRGAMPADAESLSVLARETMREAPTHFHLDHRLAADRVDALYARWAANSVTDSAADHVVVADIDGEIAGFTTAKLAGVGGDPSERYGVIPLVAVAAKFRGRGVGQRVVAAALDWLDGEGAAASCIGTQANNFRAARLYARLGLRPVNAAVSMHRWRDADIVA
jgi:dTDP-4-amino-4,6-dideoxy-D-galactose acyltransferase